MTPPPAHLKPTPFLPFYREGVVEWIDVYGFAIPLTWGDAPAEYTAIREHAAAIEFSMLLKYHVEGPGAVDTVNAVFSRDVARVQSGRIAYGVVVSAAGKMIDDCTIFMHGRDHVEVIGASEHIGESLRRHVTGETRITERRAEFARLSVQGPKSRGILQKLTGADLGNAALPYYNFITDVSIAGIAGAQINRLGFTGELGYEIVVPVSQAGTLWSALADAGREDGFRAAGGAALMTARIETGLIMGGLDYDEETTPYECRMGWAVELDKADFQGKAALAALKDKVRKRVVTIALTPAEVDYSSARLVHDGREVGTVLVAVPSPHLDGKIISMVTVEAQASAVGTVLAVDGHPSAAAEIVEMPVYDPRRLRVKG